MKTRQQKEQDIEKGKELLGGAQSLVFVDFSKTSVGAIETMKTSLREAQSMYRVIKKRLLNRVLEDKGIDVDVKQFSGQVGTVFSSKDISDAAGVVYRFSKDLKQDTFHLLGGYDMSSETFFGGEDILRIGKLPSRDILLAQVAGLVTTPLSQIAYLLTQIGAQKESTDSKEDSEEKSTPKEEAPQEEKKEVAQESKEENKEETSQEKPEEESTPQEEKGETSEEDKKEEQSS